MLLPLSPQPKVPKITFQKPNFHHLTLDFTLKYEIFLSKAGSVKNATYLKPVLFPIILVGSAAWNSVEKMTMFGRK